MRRLSAYLIFKGQPKLALAQFAKDLPQRVGRYGHAFTKMAGEDTHELYFQANGMALSVEVVDAAFKDPYIRQALDGPLAETKRDELSAIVENQSKHIRCFLDVEETGIRDWEHVHSLFHSITVFLAEWHTPAAVYWVNSQQIITGNTYLRLANRKCPWPLWLKTQESVFDDDTELLEPGYDVIGAKSFLGRPLFLEEFDGDNDQARDLATGFVMQLSNGDNTDLEPGILHVDSRIAVDVIIDEPDSDLPDGLITLIRREDLDLEEDPTLKKEEETAEFDTSAAISSIVRETQTKIFGSQRFMLFSFFALAAMAMTIGYMTSQMTGSVLAFDLDNARILELSAGSQ